MVWGQSAAAPKTAEKAVPADPAEGTPPAPGADIPKTAIESALDQQRASVRRQAGLPDDKQDSFFMVPFPPLPPTAGVAEADCDPMPDKDLKPLAETAAVKQGLKPELVEAVIQQESGGKPCAVSVKGAMGLMQLMPETASEMGATDPFDPAQNVTAGVKYLKHLLDKYHGDQALALSAYNAGQKRVDDAGGVPNLAETKNYVGAIQSKTAAAVAGGATGAAANGASAGASGPPAEASGAAGAAPKSP